MLQQSWIFGNTGREREREMADDPFPVLKQSFEEHQTRDSDQIPENITTNDIVSVDDQAIASQPLMADEMCVYVRGGSIEIEGD